MQMFFRALLTTASLVAIASSGLSQNLSRVTETRWQDPIGYIGLGTTYKASPGGMITVTRWNFPDQTLQTLNGAPIGIHLVDDANVLIAWSTPLGFTIQHAGLSNGLLTEFSSAQVTTVAPTEFLDLNYDTHINRIVWRFALQLVPIKSSLWTLNDTLAGVTWTPVGNPGDYLSIAGLRGTTLRSSLTDWIPEASQFQQVMAIVPDGLGFYDYGVALIPDSATNDFQIVDFNRAWQKPPSAMLREFYIHEGVTSIGIFGDDGFTGTLFKNGSALGPQFSIGADPILWAPAFAPLAVGDKLELQAADGRVVSQLTVGVRYEASGTTTNVNLFDAPTPQSVSVGDNFIAEIDFETTWTTTDEYAQITGYATAGLAQRPSSGLDPVIFTPLGAVLDITQTLLIPVTGFYDSEGEGLLHFSMPIADDPALVGEVFLFQFLLLDGNETALSDILGVKIEAAPGP